MRKTFLAATMLAGSTLLFGAPAHAVFQDSPNNFITVSAASTLTFTFVNKEAADVDLLFNGTVFPGTPIFSNGAAPGTAVSFSVAAGTFAISLRDTSTNVTYGSGTNTPDGLVHLRSNTTFSDFGITNPANVGPALNGYYGFEDRAFGTGNTDYNDLVFTLSVVTQPGNIPEPMSLAVLGAGLVGIGAARMRKGQNKA